MAGHSSWKNIKHRKAAADAKRGKAWSKCARAIIVAARIGGGDPEANLSLRYAILDAKAVNMPKDTIEKAIKKGTGELAGESLESAVYEGYAPGGVALLIEILTDNRNRTAGDVRMILDKHGGKLGASGCVSYLFSPKGQIIVPAAGMAEDAIMTRALDAGAEDVAAAGESWLITTSHGDLLKVRQALEAAEVTVESAELVQVPSTSVVCGGETAEKVIKLIDLLEENEDVQKVHANFEIPEEEMAKLG